MKLTFGQVMDEIKKERQRQDAKYSTLEEKQQTVAGFILILRSELAEAEAGWMKNVEGKHSSLAEILQVAAVAVACLEQYGIEGNPL